VDVGNQAWCRNEIKNLEQEAAAEAVAWSGLGLASPKRVPRWRRVLVSGMYEGGLKVDCEVT
jgi:hypothetical protein